MIWVNAHGRKADFVNWPILKRRRLRTMGWERGEEGMAQDLRKDWHAERIEDPKSYWKEERLDPAATFRPVKCVEISGSVREDLDVDLAMEVTTKIVLNGRCVVILSHLPGNIQELGLGHLISEGLIENISEVLSIQKEDHALICETEAHEIKVDLPSNPAEIHSDMRIKVSDLLKAVEGLNEQAKLWRRTGATHTSLVCSSTGESLASCEDVSRYCSLDKVIGMALFLGLDASKCCLITSGRLSEKTVSKAARAGYPIIASRSAPLFSGVMLAQKIGMTLVGFARKPNMYVYSGAERTV